MRQTDSADNQDLTGFALAEPVFYCPMGDNALFDFVNGVGCFARLRDFKIFLCSIKNKEKISKKPYYFPKTP